MTRPVVLIFHRPAQADDPALIRLLTDVREELAQRQAGLFARARAGDVRLVTDWSPGETFGRVLAATAPAGGGVVVLGSGAVPLLNRRDADLLIAAAGSAERRALTNNRYSSDICAVGDASALRSLPPLPGDNALPRWLEERAGFKLEELPGRQRLALDLDTPLDVALTALARTAPSWLRNTARQSGIAIPRLEALRALAADPHRELLVFGRSSSTTLRWLERKVRCRVRFLAEERGLRASSPLAIGQPLPSGRMLRPPRAALGLLLDQRGPESLSEVVTELADGAVVDTRVLMAHRLGANEAGWPSPADRFASDLHRPADIRDPWLRALTESAVAASQPVLLGAHSLVGPGIPLLLAAQPRPA